MQIKEGIFVVPKIRQFMKNPEFDEVLKWQLK